MITIGTFWSAAISQNYQAPSSDAHTQCWPSLCRLVMFVGFGCKPNLKVSSWAAIMQQRHTLTFLCSGHDGWRDRAEPFALSPSPSFVQGMKAGENTLNALCARVVMRGIAETGGYVRYSPLPVASTCQCKSRTHCFCLLVSVSLGLALSGCSEVKV